MSAPTVDQDALSALFAAAEGGTVPEESAASEARTSAPAARAIDFRRPRQFTSDVQRKLRRTLDTFCRTASGRLSAELRTPVDLEVIGVEQLTWSDAHGQIPSGSLTADVLADPISTRMLMSAEQSLLLAAIERMLGGSGEHPPPARRLTDIDTMLAGQLFAALVEQLSIIWDELIDARLSVVGVGGPQLTAQLAPTSEPTLAFTIEAKLFHASMRLLLLVPYRSVSPVVDRLAAVDGHDAVHDDRSTNALDRGIRRVQMNVRAEVGAVEMPVADVLALRPGDLLPLNAHSSAGVTLYVDETPLERARPGRSGARRAVQILGPVDGLR